MALMTRTQGPVCPGVPRARAQGHTSFLKCLHEGILQEAGGGVRGVALSNATPDEDLFTKVTA